MFEIRRMTSADSEAAIKLSDKVFRSDDQVSMGTAFPYIFEEAFVDHSFGAFKDGKLVSFTGLVPSSIRIGKSVVQVYSLGSVCTDEDHRGEGLASKLMEVVLPFVNKTDASLLLVSGDRELYRRNHCYPFGATKKISITATQVAPIIGNPDLAIREAESHDYLSIAKITNMREVAFEQSVGDLITLNKAQAYASCYNLSHKTLVALHGTEIVGFVIVAIPGDLVNKQSIMIEWGGAPESLLPLLTEAVHQYGIEKVEVTLPLHEKEALTTLAGFDSQLSSNQGTIRIINHERLYHQLNPYIESKTPSASWSIKEIGGKGYEVNVDGEESMLSPQDLVSFIFGYSNEKNRSSIFPVPFPYTAGLNYI